MCKPRAAALGERDSSNREPCMGDTFRKNDCELGKRKLNRAKTVLLEESAKWIEMCRPVRAATQKSISCRLLINSQRKNGPPTIEVKIPTGISAGDRIVRAIVSQTIKKAPPTKKEVGTSTR